MIFFTLIQLAKRWGKTEDEILHAAAAGFFPLSFWYEGPVYSSKLKAYASYRGHGSVQVSAIYEALVCGYETVHVSCLSNDDETFYVGTNPLLDDLPSKPQLCVNLRKGFVVLAGDVAKIEKDRPAILFGDAPDILPHEQSSMRAREQEKPLRTIKEIAKYCEVHEDTIKTWRKEYKDFPASPPGRGSVTALPTELNAWMTKRGKK